LLHALLDRGRHLLRLAVAHADHALAVTDDHQCGEAEAPTALDDLGDAVDADHALDAVALLGVTLTVVPSATTATTLVLAALAALVLRSCLPGGTPSAVATLTSRHQTALPFDTMLITTSTRLLARPRRARPCGRGTCCRHGRRRRTPRPRSSRARRAARRPWPRGPSCHRRARAPRARSRRRRPRCGRSRRRSAARGCDARSG